MEYFRTYLPEMLEKLESIVNIDSGSRYKAGVDEVGRRLGEEYKKLGFTVDVHENKKLGNNLVIRHREAADPKVLLIAHMDTVFPQGTAKERPFHIKGDYAYGPGVADMKASQISLLYAMKFIHQTEPETLHNVVIILNADEEIGSRTSRKLIEKWSRTVDYALVMEPARKDGSVVSSRRGGGRYIMRVQGKSAHSGVAPQDGISAIQELAYKITKLNKLTDHAKGISVSVGRIEGGKSINVIPDSATGYIDIRVQTKKQGREVMEQIEEIGAKPDLEGTSIDLEGGINRPPMEFNAKNKNLLEIIQSVGEKHGITVTNTHTGGGSDASFPSYMGVATIDGMGPIGDKLHNEGENILVSSIPERTLLLAETIRELSR
ncbi:M20 family metallopeptidase [Chryseomicrobium sp. FSL W7-1435]|uniref:M20 family metallopeptidase n=1 Tax=Chryseomicrobium sp. FSL W7-1435 TaxID=2921704 RepID=UPI003159D716